MLSSVTYLQIVQRSMCPDLIAIHLIIHFSLVVPKFHPEYGRYMLESTPGAPYTGSIPDLLSVENNMRYRFVPA